MKRKEKMEIKEIFSKYGYQLSSKQVEQFENYFKFLIEENEKYNLTAITERGDVFYKHFLDSILPEKFFDKGAKVIDIGSGAGFPSVPLKILRPDLKFVMVDSLNKRVNFLNQLIKLLGLSEIEAAHARAEDYIVNNREKFDYAVARAVAPLNTLLEYLVPYVKVGERCIVYKSQKLMEELEGSKKAMEELKVSIEKIEEFYIQEIQTSRKVLILKKNEKTNIKYPRGKNLPKNKPIK